MAIRKPWTREEEMKLYHLHKNFNGKDVKEKKFEELSRQIGRTHQATSRHYYHLLKYGMFSIFEQEEKTTVVTKSVSLPKKDSISSQSTKQYQVFWTGQRLKVLKEEIDKRLQEKSTYKKMIMRLMDSFSLAYSTVEFKIKDLQTETGIYDWEELSEKIGKGEIKSNNKNRAYTKKPIKKQSTTSNIISLPTKETKATEEVELIKEEHEVAHTEIVEEVELVLSEPNEEIILEQEQDIVEEQEVIAETPKKLSLFATLKNAYLSYKINQMEKKIAKLKREIQ